MKEIVFWTLALTALFYVTSHAHAADYSVKFGPGISNSRLTGSTKAFGLRYEDSIFYSLSYAAEMGGWVDNGGNGRSNSLLAKLQVGVTPGMERGIFGKAFVGPCFLNATDTQLGGHGQFCTDIGLGLRDVFTFMDIDYGHISSAGLATPNKGRDYIMFEAGFHW